MTRAEPRFWAAFALLAVCACARKPAVRRAFVSGGYEFVPQPPKRAPEKPPTKSNPPEQKPPKPAPPPPGHGAIEAESARFAGPRLLTGEPPPHERYAAKPVYEPLTAHATGAALGPSGPRPNGEDPKGAPEVQRPDELTPLPQDRPGRYTSPKRLGGLGGEPGPADPGAKTEAPDENGPVLNFSAFPAAFESPPTDPMHDRVPESAVTDPSALGQYHIQIATESGFGKPFFDHNYPFMADIDLPGDLVARRTHPGVYWIRYALVDLLGFQHPYTRPQRALLEGKKW